MNLKLSTAIAVGVFAVGMVMPNTAGAIQDNGYYITTKVCRDSHPDAGHNPVITRVCFLQYEWIETGIVEDYDYDSLYTMAQFGGTWIKEANMIPVPVANGEAKVNKAGTKVVVTAMACVGDEQATRDAVVKSALGIAQLTNGTGIAFPIGHEITLYMENGDTQLFVKLSPGTTILVAPKDGAAGACKKAS